ncbi:MAG TPA: hypothetical protein VEH06_05600 [Candidatus Bathyarchaeia archaeon]|nr:hypothetical protein [Candidatus Bathyarchaeia archaeon]
MIILQLKSVQTRDALDTLSNIIKSIHQKFDYKIKGHEIHEIMGNMEKIPLSDRANLVSSFCARNDIEYLTYHAPIIKANIYDKKVNQKIINSIYDTITESEKVASDVHIKRATIIFHLTNYIQKEKICQITKETKFDLLNASRRAFLDSFTATNIRREDTLLAVENSYPKYDSNYVAVNLFHPKEIVEYERYNIKSALDLSHYQIYLNYFLYGKGNRGGDLDREIYGSAPSWVDCIRIFGNSLVQLHINDAKGFDGSGEGLRLKMGEIPIVDILNIVNSSGRVIQGTIEVSKGHLYKGRFQMEAAEWLLTNARHVF